MGTKLICGATLALGAALLATPVAADVASHPAHIHAGSCPEVGGVVGSLEDVASGRMPEPLGTDLDVYPARSSSTSAVPVAFADLFATPHSLVVHQSSSDEGLAVFILCGNLSGTPISETDIVIGLGQLDDSGFSGVATIHDNGDATVDVAVYMTTRDAWIGDVD